MCAYYIFVITYHHYIIAEELRVLSGMLEFVAYSINAGIQLYFLSLGCVGYLRILAVKIPFQGTMPLDAHSLLFHNSIKLKGLK